MFLRALARHQQRSCCSREVLATARSFSSSQRSNGAPRSLSDLPGRAELEVAAMGRFSNLVPPRRGREIVQRQGSTYGGTHSLKWVTAPGTMLLITKKNDARALAAAKKLVNYIHEARPELTVVVESDVYDELRAVSDLIIPVEPEETSLLPRCIDFAIAIGGDGTLLRVASLFDEGAVPPVLGVSMGSLGFLMPIHIEGFPQALDELMESRSAMLLRMRLQCVVMEDGKPVPPQGHESSTVHALNEVALHRGASPHLIIIDASVDSQPLTEVVADGLILSTPTGSTAYSLSAGGPLVHPSVQSLLLTAISPRSLSFRTLLLPSDVGVHLALSQRSRGHASLSLDGHEVRTLLPSQSLQISMSPFPVPCISQPLSRLPRTDGDKHDKEPDHWLSDISRMLRFNAPFAEGRTDDGKAGV